MHDVDAIEQRLVLEQSAAWDAVADQPDDVGTARDEFFNEPRPEQAGAAGDEGVTVGSE
jgi:hypothetical protein